MYKLRLAKTDKFWDNFPNIKSYLHDLPDEVDYLQLVDLYIEVFGPSWALTTQRSEASKLKALTPIIIRFGMDPHNIVTTLTTELNRTRYYVKSLITRLAHFYQFLLDSGTVKGGAGNIFRNYTKFYQNKLFKHAYNREVGLPERWEVLAKISKLPTQNLIEHSMFLLNSGLRIDESYHIEEENGKYKVKGKGGRVRQIFVPPPTVLVKKSTLQKALAKVGLKAHTLRKLCATNLAGNGATAADLLSVMGWSKLDTAQYYLQPQNESRLKQMMGV